MYQIRKCKVCGSAWTWKLRTFNIDAQSYPDLHAAVGAKRIELGMRLCLRCGFIFYDHILSPEEMRDLYVYEQRGVRPKKESTRADRLRVRALSFMRKNVNLKPRDEVLDVGAGDFHIIKAVGDLGRDIDLSAINVSYPSDRYEDVAVYHDMLESSSLERKFNFVILSHIIEHVADFKPFFRKVREILHPGAVLYVEVPYQIGVTLLLKRNFHTQHINYFSPETLVYLLAQEGFSNDALEFDRRGYNDYGIPGIIRATFTWQGPLKVTRVPHVWSTVWHLLDPLPYVNSIFKRPTEER